MEALLTLPHRRHGGAARALDASARLWFVTAVIGQWSFAAYVAGFYGAAAVRGHWLAWNKVLTHGYEVGNPIGNAILGLHLLLAVTITFGGPLQLVPAIRSRWPRFHRWSGRAYVLAAFVMGATGLYLIFSGRKLVGDGRLSIALNAVLIIVCAAMAAYLAMARRFAGHRRWALRLYLLVNGVWFFRVGLMFWLFVNGRPVGFDPKTFSGPFLTLLGYGQYLLPLAVLELYLRARDRGPSVLRWSTAATLAGLSVAMGIGIFAALMGLWLPRLSN